MESISSPSPKFVEAMAKIEKAKKRVFYKRLGAFALAIALSATGPTVSKAIGSNKTTITMPEKTPDNDTPITITTNTSSPEFTPPSAGVEAASISTPVQTDLVDNDTVSTDNIVSTDAAKTEVATEPTKSWDGPVLDPYVGHIDGPTGDETFYNLPMDEIVARMHRIGYEGDYWEREDGVKMLGDYVMVAADLKVHPRGSIVETSLGTGIVCDTGGFAKEHHNRLDIATNWEDPRDNS